MKRILMPIGEDDRGYSWAVEIQENKINQLHWVYFIASHTTFFPSPTAAPTMATAEFKSYSLAKLKEIKVDPHDQAFHVGRCLLNFVEHWLAERKIVEIYGDISEVDRPRFVKNKHFYESNGWIWELFDTSNIKGNTVGRVYKRLNTSTR